MIFQLSTVEIQKNSKNSNVSSIDLGECEDKLKSVNHIPKEESLIIFKVDVKVINISTTYVQYEVYSPLDLHPLNLSVCEDISININVPVDMDSQIELYYCSLNESGYNLFDENDPFYQDICSPYTTPNETDILLNDRKTDIYKKTQNQGLCQKGCEFQSYDLETKRILCNCNLMEQQEKMDDINDVIELFDKIEIKESFYETMENSNFHALNCPKLIFDKSIYVKNIGSILMTIIFAIFLILFSIFLKQCNQQINDYINLVIQIKEKTFNKNKYSKSDKKNTKENNLEKGDNNYKKRKNKMQKLVPPKKEKNKIKINNKIKNSSNKTLLKKIVTGNFNNGSYSPNKKNNITIHDQSKSLSKISLYNKNSINKINSKNCKNNIDINYNIFINDYELNSLNYELALLLDKRTYIQYYWSLLKTKQLILFTFILRNDYNLLIVKISLFIVTFSLSFTTNGFFFTDKSIRQLYEDNGLYDFIYEMPQIIFSSLVSIVIGIIIKTLSLTWKDFYKLKKETNKNIFFDKCKKIDKFLKIKLSIFFITSFIFMIFFWFFISCFCAVFINSQTALIKDTLISFSLSMLYPFGINLIPGIFRISALRQKDKKKECIYKIGQLIALF